MGANRGGRTAPIPLDHIRAGERSTRPAGLNGRGGLRRLAGPLRVAFAGRTSTEDQQDPTLSIPRQLASSRAALPDEAMIVAHFYDVESGRKDLADRGHGRGHERLVIPVPRDGGINDLLDEADRADRRFDVVICESIDRISRRTYVGTLIENRLEKAGVLLWASDEPISLTGNRASQILTRRVKQGVAEWYVLELLEKSWGGFETHTDQGYNVGKPPYGYMAHKIPHPVPARRAEGRTKHKLVIDPVRGPVVTVIFELRVARRLAYPAIAEHLNSDLDRFPSPQPVDPTVAVGRWTPSAVRGVLTNPKYTGYMVWNRRASKTGGGGYNPPESWVWSAQPSHEPLITKEAFIAAQQVAAGRERVRSGPGKNAAHRQTKRDYRLRSYVFCSGCDRRMFGKTRHDIAYYACQPGAGYRPENHPASIWVREEHLMEIVARFFADRIFAPGRSRHLADLIRVVDQREADDHKAHIEALTRAVDDLEIRRLRLVRQLEFADDLMRDIQTRAAELTAQRETKTTELARLRSRLAQSDRPAPELLDALPVGPAQLAEAPPKIFRDLCEAFRLELRYDRRANTVTCRVTLTGETLPGLRDVSNEILHPETENAAHQAENPAAAVPICAAPPAVCGCRTSAWRVAGHENGLVVTVRACRRRGW